MAKVLALKNHVYAGRKRSAGETYEVDDLHIPVLRTARLVSVVEDELGPESEPESELDPEEPKPKRRYKRRDMRAET